MESFGERMVMKGSLKLRIMGSIILKIQMKIGLKLNVKSMSLR